MTVQRQVRVPQVLYSVLIERLKSCPLDESLKSFLGARCEKAFLVRMLNARPDILEWAAKVNANNQTFSGKLLIAALASWELMPEEVRKRIATDVQAHSIDWLDARPLTDKILRQIFKETEFAEYEKAFRKEWLSDIPSVFSEFGRFSSEDEIGLYTDFKENLQAAQAHFELEDDEAFDELYAEIDSHIEDLEAQRPATDGSEWSPSSMEKPSSSHSDTIALIFVDVDD